MYLILAGLCEVSGTLLLWLYKGSKRSMFYIALGLIALGFLFALLYTHINNLSVIVFPK